MRLALVRAATPEWGERLVGRAELPLSSDGVARARAAAALVLARGEVARVYSPPAGHAAEAAAALAAALPGVPVTIQADLAEIHFGLWQGLAESELVRRHKTSFRAFLTDARAVVAPEGEEIDAARDRLAAVLDRLRRKHARDPRWAVLVASEFAFALLDSVARGTEAPPALWRERAQGADVRFHEIG